MLEKIPKKLLTVFPRVIHRILLFLVPQAICTHYVVDPGFSGLFFASRSMTLTRLFLNRTRDRSV